MARYVVHGPSSWRVEDSSEYYQQNDVSAVTGVYSATEFESLQPVIPVVIDRGTSIDMSAQLVDPR